MNEMAKVQKTEREAQPPWSNPRMAHVGGFEALDTEQAYWVDNSEIRGRIPDSVRGTFFRIGPGRNKIGDELFGHWFDGDGMLHALTFDERGAWYRNKYVRTPKYLDETAAQKIVHRSFGHNAPGGILKNFGRQPANCANTSLTWHGGRLLALWEGGRPWQLDPVTLDTVGEFNFDGKLGMLDAFSAHGKIDPDNGYYYNHGLGVGKRGPQVSVYRISPEGTLEARTAFPIKLAAFVHDFALAGDYLVYFIHPVGFRNPLPFMSGWKSFNDCVRFNPKWGMEVKVLNKHTLEPVASFQVDPFVVFHFGNSWVEGDELVVNLMRFEDFSVNETISDVFHAENNQGGRPWQYRLNLASGQHSHGPLPLQHEGEFPQWDWRYSGHATRYLYSSTLMDNGTPGFFNGQQRLDLATGEIFEHDFGDGFYTSEAMFVPEGSAEGDGYLVCAVYDAWQHRSEIRLLDARKPGLPEVAAVPLRNHIPFGFHCGYTERAFLP